MLLSTFKSFSLVLKEQIFFQISNFSFKKNKFSSRTSKVLGRFQIQIKFNGQRDTKCTIDKNTNYTTNSTDRTPLKIDFTEPNYVVKLVYDQIDTTLADMCFS